MIYKGMTILEQYVRYEIWDGKKCIQSDRPEFVAYLVEELDGSMYEDLADAKEAIDKVGKKSLLHSTK